MRATRQGIALLHHDHAAQATCGHFWFASAWRGAARFPDDSKDRESHETPSIALYGMAYTVQEIGGYQGVRWML